ncbi:MAG: macrolide ABC transporter ATP-binding protein [Gammaproteobacteria bacterium RIFCSPHIGHO2_12_FULL_63_22]|nr:MAG: macrolide ABC transporter ATP-binding protein [Gammaproteobacteria bacterium RIFCSPHIGHO2_12_FULL_63_22]
MTDATPIIQTEDLRKVYSPGTQAEVKALDGVNLRIDRGEFVAIMGASGSGKSTLMNVIGCLDRPSGGRYLCDGVDVASLDAESLARLRLEKIGFVFQGFNLLSRMDALHNVMMPLGYSNTPLAERTERARAALEAVGLGERAHHRPGEMSGGQQQRVSIARALINQPALVLADEPTGALDTRTSAEVMKLFEKLKAQGQTIVLITHEADVAHHADRICVMRDGKLYEGEHGLGAVA